LRARFSAYELRELELAERECPWGEAAENLRTLLLAATVRHVLGDKNAGEAIRRIENLLLGPPPKRKKKRRS